MRFEQCSHCKKLFSTDYLVDIAVRVETGKAAVIHRFFVCKKCKESYDNSYWQSWIEAKTNKANCQLAPVIGWLSPAGRYYIASNPEAEWQHYEIGVAIYKSFYPDEDIPNEFEMNSALLRKGYIRVDVIDIGFDRDAFYKPTSQQIDTLFNLYLNKGWQSWRTPAAIRRFLVEISPAEFGFLKEEIC